jgi:DNA oxidative demethylase
MMDRDPMELRPGVRVWHGFVDREGQEALVDDVRRVVAAAPLFRPVTARGRPMSVRMTSAGNYGWVSDRSGYRYEARHPEGMAWPAIPDRVLDIWNAVSGVERPPQCCLVNFYDAAAKMGLHQDRDEADFAMPVVSVSLGDDALFRVGGTARGGPTQSVWLSSGDVAVLSGEARLVYHGIDRIRPGSSTLLPKGGRINLTLRVVD